MREGGPAAVTMGSVAERAEVTRALVYKHFDNRNDILVDPLPPRSRALDRQLRRQVIAAETGSSPSSGLVHPRHARIRRHPCRVLHPSTGFGQIRAPAASNEAGTASTLDYFTTLASDEFELDPSIAKPAIGVLLSGIVSLLTQTRSDHIADRQAFLEDLFVDMAVASLTSLATTTPGRHERR